jgi:hypothetical protein
LRSQEKTTKELPVRVPTYTIVVPLLTALAFAQETPPPQTQRPTGTATPSTAVQDKSADKTKDKAMDKDRDKTAGSSDRLAEMKTQIYSGTLMDASCAGSGPAPSTASADRAAAPAPGDTPGCTVSASTTQFAIKLKDGQVMKFDSVGNMRAQEAFKLKKKWADNATANKPIRVKVSGVLNGEKLTVVSIG